MIIESIIFAQVECSVGGWPCVLACSVVWPCLRAEQLLVSVGAHGGRLRARVPAYPTTPRMPELAAALAAANVPLVKSLLTQLRYPEPLCSSLPPSNISFVLSLHSYLGVCLRNSR